jgi:NAD(P)-dependent dehydrogenase (short-subunit alcohol dehydrogenase family)
MDLDAEGLAEAQAELGSEFVPVHGDATSWATHEKAAGVASRIGRLRGWVNNAGIDITGAAGELSGAEIERGLRAVQLGPMFGMAVASRVLASQDGGAIVNVSSIQGIAAFPRYFVYGAAKAALLQATRSVAVDYALAGVRCNAVLPGTIETPMTIAALGTARPIEEALREEGDLSPMRRVGQASEVADVIAFLLSDASSYINGASVVVDGAATARCYPYPSISL